MRQPPSEIEIAAGFKADGNDCLRFANVTGALLAKELVASAEGGRP
jgi:hypothetical protein